MDENDWKWRYTPNTLVANPKSQRGYSGPRHPRPSQIEAPASALHKHWWWHWNWWYSAPTSTAWIAKLGPTGTVGLWQTIPVSLKKKRLEIIDRGFIPVRWTDVVERIVAKSRHITELFCVNQHTVVGATRWTPHCAQNSPFHLPREPRDLASPIASKTCNACRHWRQFSQALITLRCSQTVFFEGIYGIPLDSANSRLGSGIWISGWVTSEIIHFWKGHFWTCS